MSTHSIPGRAATSRIAWICEDRDTLRLLREPLLAELIADRHKVLALAPGLTDADRLALLARGIDCHTFKLPRLSLLPLARFAARRHLADTLRSWNARAMVADGEAVLGLGLRAALMAGVPQLFAVMPPAVGLARGVTLGHTGLLRDATRVFVNSTEDARQVAERGALLGRSSVPDALTVLPLSCFDRTSMAPAPLPLLDGGFIFRGIGGQAPGTFEAAAAHLDKRAARWRLQIIRHAEATERTAGGSIETIACDLANEAQRAAALSAAHVVVIDGHSAQHRCALATALIVGRPVLAIDTALTRDLIDSGANGWLVADDPTAMAAAMQSILRRPDLLPGMARVARQKAERRFERSHVRLAVLAGLELGGPTALVA